MIISKIPLLFVRYAPGAAGNFLIAILQTSNKLSCWDTQVENVKGTPQFEDFFKNWFSKCFQADLENHIKYEPHHPYQLDFVSAKHPRGDDPVGVTDVVSTFDLVINRCCCCCC